MCNACMQLEMDFPGCISPISLLFAVVVIAADDDEDEDATSVVGDEDGWVVDSGDVGGVVKTLGEVDAPGLASLLRAAAAVGLADTRCKCLRADTAVASAVIRRTIADRKGDDSSFRHH